MIVKKYKITRKLISGEKGDTSLNFISNKLKTNINITLPDYSVIDYTKEIIYRAYNNYNGNIDGPYSYVVIPSNGYFITVHFQGPTHSSVCTFIYRDFIKPGIFPGGITTPSYPGETMSTIPECNGGYGYFLVFPVFKGQKVHLYFRYQKFRIPITSSIYSAYIYGYKPMANGSITQSDAFYFSPTLDTLNTNWVEYVPVNSYPKLSRNTGTNRNVWTWQNRARLITRYPLPVNSSDDGKSITRGCRFNSGMDMIAYIAVNGRWDNASLCWPDIMPILGKAKSSM